MARISTPPSSLAISIDVELKRVIHRDSEPLDHLSLVEHRSRSKTLQQLLQLFRKAQLPATWGFSDPGSSPFVPELLDDSRMHEVALLGDASWISLESGRGGFCQHLVQRVSDARRAGCQLSTLAIYDGHLQDGLDLLAKHQISMVRYPQGKQRKSKQSPRHRTLRYGLWEAPRAVRVAPVAAMWGWQPRMVINQVIRRTIRHGGVGHIVLDVTAPQGTNARVLKFVSRVLEMVNRYHRAGNLQVITLQELAEQWRPRQQGVRARSLLRVAA